MTAGVVPADLLITRIVPLADTAAAFGALASGDARKILVTANPDPRQE